MLPGWGRCELLTITETMKNGTRFKCSRRYLNDTTFSQKHREFYYVINMSNTMATRARQKTIEWRLHSSISSTRLCFRRRMAFRSKSGINHPWLVRSYRRQSQIYQTRGNIFEDHRKQRLSQLIDKQINSENVHYYIWSIRLLIRKR